MVVRARCRATDDVVVLVWIRHIVIRGAGHPSLDRHLDIGGDHFHYNSGDDVDQHPGHTKLGADIDKHLDHNDHGSIVGHGDSCHRPVGSRA